MLLLGLAAGIAATHGGPRLALFFLTVLATLLVFATLLVTNALLAVGRSTTGFGAIVVLIGGLAASVNIFFLQLSWLLTAAVPLVVVAVLLALTRAPQIGSLLATLGAIIGLVFTLLVVAFFVAIAGNNYDFGYDPPSGMWWPILLAVAGGMCGVLILSQAFISSGLPGSTAILTFLLVVGLLLAGLRCSKAPPEEGQFCNPGESAPPGFVCERP